MGSEDLPEIAVCELCNTVYVSEYELNCHKNLYHDSTASLRKQICLKCGNNFSSVSALYRHLRQVHKDLSHLRRPLKTIPCDYDGCTLMFCRKGSLRRHKRLIHGQDEPTEFICAICGHCASSKIGILRHLNLVHPFKRNDDPSSLQTILPGGYMYKILSFEFLDNKHETFSSKFTFVVKDKEAGLQWFENFVKSNNLYLKPAYCRISKKSHILYKMKYLCQHNVGTNKSKDGTPKRALKFSKQTFCPWMCLFQISEIEDGKSTDSNLVVQMKVRLRHAHNHDSKFSIHFLQPTPEVKEKFLKLFKSGFTPSKALKIYLRELEDKYEDRFSELRENSSIVPKKQWIYRFYRTMILSPKNKAT